ncbi:hypothetical protein C8R43DRAFT_1123501 [Mycena crocata]|nr:hypothetical protein C8R43DRAFT_1123501 [Mycena crocata]
MPFGLNPFGEGALPEGVIRHIYVEHVGMYELSATDLLALQRVSPLFYRIFRPYTYRYVNLRTPSDAIAFFSIVKSPRYDILAEAVRSLQLSFNMDPETYEDPGPEIKADLGLWAFQEMNALDWEAFWIHFREGLPKLSLLSTLSLSFSHDDDNILGRLVENGDLIHSLPSSVMKLHLKPVPEEYHHVELVRHFLRFLFLFLTRMQELAGEGPWDHPSWRSYLAQIPHIKEFFVTSPMYIVWPPTQDNLDRDIKYWTRALRRADVAVPSSLRRIILNCGFGDEGASLETWNEAEEEDQVAEAYEDDKSDGHRFLCQLVWERKGKGGKTVWKELDVYFPSHSLREEYLFGEVGREFLFPWIHIDLEKEAKSFRLGQKQHGSRRGNGILY